MLTDNHYDVIDDSDYLNQTLLLTNSARSGLFVHPQTANYVAVKIDRTGKITILDLENVRGFNTKETLGSIVNKYITQEHLPMTELLKYLVTPEMEIERIFNNVRYKYLQSVFLSNFENPQEYFSSQYNRAFQALSGIIVYQGNCAQRKPNESFWQDGKFSIAAKNQDWEKERNELQKIIMVLKTMNKTAIEKTYAELIAIKPGFHEIYLHDDYFHESSLPKSQTARDFIFRALRNKENLSHLHIDRFPYEINKNSYFSYAACCITEGPFVFRKNIKTSYYQEIRKIKSEKQRNHLKDKFYILDYYHGNISTKEKLAVFLGKAKRFRDYL